MNDINYIIDNIKGLGLKLELIGSWLWVSGNTFKHKERLKELGLFYSGNKKAWFFNGQEAKTHKAFYKNLIELENKFGYTTIEEAV